MAEFTFEDKLALYKRISNVLLRGGQIEFRPSSSNYKTLTAVFSEIFRNYNDYLARAYQYALYKYAPDFIINNERKEFSVSKFYFVGKLQNYCLQLHDNTFIWTGNGHFDQNDPRRFRSINIVGTYTMVWINRRLVYQVIYEMNLFEEINLIDVILDYIKFKR